MNTPIRSFPIAKLLKEKGFDESTEANWWILAKDHSENYSKKLPPDESKIFFSKDSYELEMKTQIDEDTEHNVYHVLSAPTIAEVVMWLYEKHKIWISIDMVYEEDQTGFWYCIRESKSDDVAVQSKEYSTPTEAYEAAILYTLNNLI